MMKLALMPARSVKKKTEAFFASLNEPVTATKELALLCGLTIFFGGVVIGFLTAPARTRTLNFGTNTVYKNAEAAENPAPDTEEETGETDTESEEA